MSITLTKISETQSTITLGWTAVPNVVGYRFTVDGKISHTFDPQRTSVKVSKTAGRVLVEALGVEDEGSYPPVTPPPPGTVEYRHTYTGGQATPTDYGWDWGMQYTGGVPTSNFTLIPNGIATGLPSGRMVLNSGGTQSIEGLRKWTLGIGETWFYGMMIKFPSNWTEPSPAGWGAAVTQLGYQGCTESTTGLFVHADHATFVILSGEQKWPNGVGPDKTVVREYNNNEAQGPPPKVIPPGMALNVWHELIFEIRWSTCSTRSANYGTVGSAGHARAWHRLMGDTNWTKTMDLPDIPTLQWGPCRYGGVWPVNPVGSNVAHKFGLYAAGATVTRTIEHGNIAIDGPSFESVAALMP